MSVSGFSGLMIKAWETGQILSEPNEFSMINKAQSRSIRVQMRGVLLSTWDPIGVKDSPEAQDEYDSYIGPLYDLLASGAPDSALLDYLYWAAHEHMGLGASRKDMQETVDALRRIAFPKPSP
jgi:hypothetical protein